MRDEILNMKPGRELDALVAEKVMGKKVMPGQFCRRFSSDISASWEVVEKVKGMGIRARLAFAKHLKEMFKASGTHEIAAWPEAIFLLEPKHLCTAALLAVLEDKS